MRAKYFEADLVKKLNTFENYTKYHVLWNYQRRKN